MEQAAPVYQERYTRPDGSFVWRPRWPGMDGSDDGYESYHNWPLFYALGGAADLHERSRFLWEAVTRQFTGYGQIHREFDAYYDWMHHGESSLYLYYFGLADPRRQPDRARALRFAGMYLGTDPEAANWDAARRMIRSPITGSRGPRFENTFADWEAVRWVLADYPVPFADLEVPTTDALASSRKPRSCWSGPWQPMQDRCRIGNTCSRKSASAKAGQAVPTIANTKTGMRWPSWPCARWSRIQLHFNVSPAKAFPCNTACPNTVGPKAKNIRQRFGIVRIALVDGCAKHAMAQPVGRTIGGIRAHPWNESVAVSPPWKTRPKRNDDRTKTPVQCCDLTSRQS